MRYDKIERSVSTELWPVASRAVEATIHTCRIIRPVVFFFSISEQHGDEMLVFCVVKDPPVSIYQRL